MIKLGDKCRDTVSGFHGTAVARTIWLNGCQRITIAPNTLDKDGKVQESYTFDEQQVELIEEKPVENHAPHVKTGGPAPEPRRAADPR